MAVLGCGHDDDGGACYGLAGAGDSVGNSVGAAGPICACGLELRRHNMPVELLYGGFRKGENRAGAGGGGMEKASKATGIVRLLYLLAEEEGLRNVR